MALFNFNIYIISKENMLCYFGHLLNQQALQEIIFQYGTLMCVSLGLIMLVHKIISWKNIDCYYCFAISILEAIYFFKWCFK